MAQRVSAALGAGWDVAGRAEPRADPVAQGVPPGALEWSPLPAGDGTVDVAAPGGRRRRPGELLLQRLRFRSDPGRHGALAIGSAALIAAVLTGAWVWSARPHSVPVSSTVATQPAGTQPAAAGRVDTVGSANTAPAPATSAPAAGPSATGPPVVVDVVGRVRRPGLYTLAPGARVYDAVKAAGGALHGVSLDALNLAARVSDGQQVAVGISGVGGGGGTSGGSGAGPAGAGTGSGTGAATGPVNLNTATLEQLDALPGVGPVLAQHILDWRAAHGSFGSVDQLRDVTGIGDVKFTALRPLVTV